jgi:hypothetical protein
MPGAPLSFPKIISERIGDVTARDWHYCDLTDPLDRSPQWRILPERPMRARLIVISSISKEHTA